MTKRMRAKIIKTYNEFVIRITKYERHKDTFHKNKIERCLFFKIALRNVQYLSCFLPRA